MILFDVNILIYAHREDQIDHGYYREKLEARVRQPHAFGLTSLTAGGFLRITTHPHFPNGPTPLPQALAFIESLLHLPNAHWIQPASRHWEIFSSLLRTTRATGKAVADAQHAAIAMEHACIWITRDTDFEAFAQHGLRLEPWIPEV